MGPDDFLFLCAKLQNTGLLKDSVSITLSMRAFMLRSGLIAPYKSIRYHLKEYSTQAPENAKELFNLRHASLRNAVERAFGVLKKRFPIIGSANEKTYSFDVQCEIILACCILHNFLMGMDPDESLVAEMDADLSNREEVED
ncbi:hypothetical protein GH714_013011 [Hevea brasiliensis]|uniref:DDE Tnp4 domain-containing protein n=1 Tax=Hevea brasiliensis TaxID=3981 RepID=A0A6A6N0X2_HEVBR|nr:hypothetical protein GH714_013011 [Hevea brasiliensis]